MCVLLYFTVWPLFWCHRLCVHGARLTAFPCSSLVWGSQCVCAATVTSVSSATSWTWSREVPPAGLLLYRSNIITRSRSSWNCLPLTAYSFSQEYNCLSLTKSPHPSNSYRNLSNTLNYRLQNKTFNHWITVRLYQSISLIFISPPIIHRVIQALVLHLEFGGTSVKVIE